MSTRESIQQVAARLRGLRDALDMTQAEIANACGIDTDTYARYESGEVDIPISFIQKLAESLNLQVPEILFGSSPKMQSYYVTRAGKGAKVERSKAYSYQSLAEGFADRLIHPYLVTIDPAHNAHRKPNSHDGQEFNYVIDGRVEYHIGKKVLVLEAGDSIIFNAALPHFMLALDDKPAQFITVPAM